VPERDHDVVLLGASGFVGRLVAAHLAAAAPPGTRVALAGRSRSRVEEVRAGLPAAAADWPVLEADTSDEASLAALAASTAVLATTVGPYLQYGLPVVRACAAAGTSYCDLTGEVLFVRRAIDAADAEARRTGARIVHACGYDSIPSDLATHLLASRARSDGAGGLRDVQLVAAARGGASGGTVASVVGLVEEAARDAAARRLLADPYALSPDRSAEPSVRQPSDAPPPGRTAEGVWTAPFVMSSFNTRIVRRSNALQDWSYGRDMRYGEVMATGRGPVGAATAVGVTAGLGAGFAALAFPPTRSLLHRFLPAPGTGPSEATRESGWFRSVVTATTDDGGRYRATAAGKGDPGYAATAVMFGQTALALALDRDRLPDGAGSLTPATALGDVLVERLRAAGHTYEVVPA
jgi:short subunit dehydrogenase-like uncharacterized protein